MPTALSRYDQTPPRQCSIYVKVGQHSDLLASGTALDQVCFGGRVR